MNRRFPAWKSIENVEAGIIDRWAPLGIRRGTCCYPYVDLAVSAGPIRVEEKAKAIGGDARADLATGGARCGQFRTEFRDCRKAPLLGSIQEALCFAKQDSETGTWVSFTKCSLFVYSNAYLAVI